MYRPMRQNKPRRVIHDVAELPVLCDCAEAGLLLRRNPEVIAKMAKEGVLKGAKQMGRVGSSAVTIWWSIWTSSLKQEAQARERR